MIKKYSFFLLSLAMLINFSSCKNEAQDTAVTEATTAKTPHPAKRTTQQKVKKEKNDQSADTNHLNTGGMQWMTFEDVARMEGSGNKKYLVDVYTDWCGWCKVMDRKTFTDPEVQKYLDENFHIVKFNAESKTPVTFKGSEYEWMGQGKKGINRLAIELLGSRMSYPTMVYLDENLDKIRSIPGYKKPDQLLADLQLISGK